MTNKQKKKQTRLRTAQTADAHRSAMLPFHGCGISSYVTVIKFSIRYIEAELIVQNLGHIHNTNAYMGHKNTFRIPPYKLLTPALHSLSLS